MLRQSASLRFNGSETKAAELANAAGQLVRLYDSWSKKDSVDAFRSRLATHKP